MHVRLTFLMGALCLFITTVIHPTRIAASDQPFDQLIPVQLAAHGHAVAASQLGAESIYANPAGLSRLSHWQSATTYATYYNATFQSYGFTIAGPVWKNGVIAVALPVKTIPNIPKTKETDGEADPIGTFSDTELAGKIALAHQLTKQLSVGAGVSVYQQTIDKHSANGTGFNAGVHYQENTLSAGVLWQNIGSTTVKWDTGRKTVYKDAIQAGLRWEAFNGFALEGDVAYQTKIDGHVGAEWTLLPEFKVVGGLQNLSTLGVGAQLTLGTLTLMYSYTEHADLGLTHRMGVSWQFK